jgi:hypothetical protein
VPVVELDFFSFSLSLSLIIIVPCRTFENPDVKEKGKSSQRHQPIPVDSLSLSFSL